MKGNWFHSDRRGLLRKLLAVILIVSVLTLALPAMLLTPAAAQSQPGEDWISRTSNTTLNLNRVTWGDSQYVAVGTLGTILTSGSGNSPPGEKQITRLTASHETGYVGDTVTVRVNISNAMQIEGGQFDLYYGPTLGGGAVKLVPISVSRGDFVPNVSNNSFDFNMNIEGSVRVLWVVPEGSKKGSGSVCTIVFRIIEAGETPLSFSDVEIVNPPIGHIVGPHTAGKVTGLTSPPPVFRHNDIVMTTIDGARVRDDNNNIIQSWRYNGSGLLPKGIVGKIVGGPEIREVGTNKYVFWKINWHWNFYCEQVEGWTAEDFLSPPVDTTDETYWLARMIMSEANPGNHIERAAVGWTAMNRKNLNLDRFGGNTIFGVVSKWQQYSLKQVPTKDILDLAGKILRGEEEDPVSGSGPATHFFSPRSMSPSNHNYLVPNDGSVPDNSIGKAIPYPNWAVPKVPIKSDTKEFDTFDNRKKWQQRSTIRNWYFMVFNHNIYKYTATLGNPGELRVYDSIGRVTGLVNGIVYEEIYDSEYVDGSIIINYPDDTYLYEVTGTEEGIYGLRILEAGVVGDQSVTLSNVSTTIGAVHYYTIDWGALSIGQLGVKIKKDSDGDGIFEETILTAPPHVPTKPQPEHGSHTVTLNALLRWNGGSADPNDTVDYQIYFGTNQQPALIKTVGSYPAEQTSITYFPGYLNENTRYYWQIKAIDAYGITSEGPVWSFTTSTVTSPPTPTPVPPPPPDPTPKPDLVQKTKLGDVTGDGKIDIEDATLVMQHALGLKALTDNQKKAADVNGDGKIDIRDVVLIMRKALGLIDKFPIE